MLTRPNPPRPWCVYSAKDVRLPCPCSHAVSSVMLSVLSDGMHMRPTTASPFLSLMPLTPCVARPICRTSVSRNLMAMPSRVQSIISSDPPVIRTPISRSPLSRLIAMMPPRWGRPYALRAVFFTIPCSVAITRFRSSNLRTGIIDVIRTSGGISSRFTIDRPCDVRPSMGTSYTFSQWTLPSVVKNRM